MFDIMHVCFFCIVHFHFQTPHLVDGSLKIALFLFSIQGAAPCFPSSPMAMCMLEKVVGQRLLPKEDVRLPLASAPRNSAFPKHVMFDVTPHASSRVAVWKQCCR